MIYSLNNILLNLKCFNMKSTHEYFQSVSEIIKYLIKYHMLKTQAVITWRKDFSDVKQKAKNIKDYILKISYFVSNSS